VIRTRIKICGIGRVEDALAAARAGADAIGLVFQKSAARYVTPQRAQEILAALPPFVTPVGLFVDAPASEVRALARSLGLRHVQLHGHEDADYVRDLREFVILKAIRVARETFASEMNAWKEQIHRGGLSHFRGIVLETAGAGGGTGLVNDWQFIHECQSQGLFAGLPPLIAAGGLAPANVAEVVRVLRPWAVDVSSGVEGSKGIKSVEKIEAFVREARGIDANIAD
jgi:phosphoribosylanthranilate isomerase